MTSYNIGGSLPAQDSGYVLRAADRQLADYLQTGGFCYILTARQMGKSSLKVRTMQNLTAAGVACAAIDLTAIGAAQVSARQWYNSIADELASQFYRSIGRAAVGKIYRDDRARTSARSDCNFHR
jgi:hypothetical protein